MPRKTDGIPFILRPLPTKGCDGNPLLYASLEPGRKINLAFLDDEFRGLGRYQRGDVKRMFEVFAMVAGHYIAEGYRIETPFGSFAPKLKIDGEYTDSADVGNGCAYISGVSFTPSKMLKREIEKHYRGCLKITTPVGNAQMYDELLMEKALKECIKDTGIVTIRSFCIHSQLKYKSACRFLNSLCEGDNARFKRVKQGGIILYLPTHKEKINEQQG